MSKLGKITRRTFLIGSAAIAGGVAFGTYSYLKAPVNPLSPGPDEVTLNPYLLITKDKIIIITPRAEMGQGIHTTLAALVAEELDVPMEMITAEHGPASETYYNATALSLGLPFADYSSSTLRDIAESAVAVPAKFIGMQITGGSTSTRDAFERMRSAGAAARVALVKSASFRLGVSIENLETQGGYVVAPDGQRLSYYELAADAAKTHVPSRPDLKPRSEWRHLGKSLPRVDMRAKVDGTAEFGIDIKMPDMLYATVRMNPRLGGKMKSFDAIKALQKTGVEKVVDLGDGVGLIATSTWRAFKAAEALEIEWDDAPYPPTSEALFETITKAFDGEVNASLRADGNAQTTLNTAQQAVEAEYRVPFLAHLCMEPLNATALLGDGRLDIWCGNQAPTLIRDHAAAIAGLESASVHVHTLYMGGGFGRRSETDFANQAVRLAMAMPGRPVKLTWTREEDTTHDYYRPAAVARLKGAIGGGRPSVLQADIATPSVLRQQSQRAIGAAMPGPDKLLVEGAFDQPYGITDYQVNGYISDLPVPVGPWRSVGNSYNAFFHECFIDELAHSGNLDPIQMRLELMTDVDEPSRRVIETVAEMANWSGRRNGEKARGVAFTYSFGSPTAQIVELSQSEGVIKIEKVWCAIDVGIALDRRNIEAQMMSGIIFGLSAAIYNEITFDDGRVQQTNFHDYETMRLYQAPAIETRVLENKAEMGGVGEPGTPPSMPALANAVFALTGQRIRSLPLNQHVDFV